VQCESDAGACGEKRRGRDFARLGRKDRGLGFSGKVRRGRGEGNGEEDDVLNYKGLQGKGGQDENQEQIIKALRPISKV